MKNLLEKSETYYVSLRGLASVLGISPERVRQLEDEGILKGVAEGRRKYFELWHNLTAYVEFRRVSADGYTVVTEAEAAEADLRYRKAKAEKIEIEVAELKGQMHRSEDVEAVVGDMVSGIRAFLVALPGRLAVDVAQAASAREASDIIQREVEHLLVDLMKYTYDPAKYAALVREREKWMRAAEDPADDGPVKSKRGGKRGTEKPVKKAKGRAE